MNLLKTFSWRKQGICHRKFADVEKISTIHCHAKCFHRISDYGKKSLGICNIHSINAEFDQQSILSVSNVCTAIEWQASKGLQFCIKKSQNAKHPNTEVSVSVWTVHAYRLCACICNATSISCCQKLLILAAQFSNSQILWVCLYFREHFKSVWMWLLFCVVFSHSFT